jgi:hypothetical protein
MTPCKVIFSKFFRWDATSRYRAATCEFCSQSVRRSTTVTLHTYIPITSLTSSSFFRALCVRTPPSIFRTTNKQANQAVVDATDSRCRVSYSTSNNRQSCMATAGRSSAVTIDFSVSEAGPMTALPLTTGMYRGSVIISSSDESHQIKCDDSSGRRCCIARE